MDGSNSTKVEKMTYIRHKFQSLHSIWIHLVFFMIAIILLFIYFYSMVFVRWVYKRRLNQKQSLMVDMYQNEEQVKKDLDYDLKRKELMPMYKHAKDIEAPRASPKPKQAFEAPTQKPSKSDQLDMDVTATTSKSITNIPPVGKRREVDQAYPFQFFPIPSRLTMKDQETQTDGLKNIEGNFQSIDTIVRRDQQQKSNFAQTLDSLQDSLTGSSSMNNLNETLIEAEIAPPPTYSTNKIGPDRRKKRSIHRVSANPYEQRRIPSNSKKVEKSKNIPMISSAQHSVQKPAPIRPQNVEKRGKAAPINDISYSMKSSSKNSNKEVKSKYCGLFPYYFDKKEPSPISDTSVDRAKIVDIKTSCSNKN